MTAILHLHVLLRRALITIREILSTHSYCYLTFCRRGVYGCKLHRATSNNCEIKGVGRSHPYFLFSCLLITARGLITACEEFRLWLVRDQDAATKNGSSSIIEEHRRIFSSRMCREVFRNNDVDFQSYILLNCFYSSDGEVRVFLFFMIFVTEIQR